MGLLKTNFAAGDLHGVVGEMVIAKHKRGVKVVRKRPVRTVPARAGEAANRHRFAAATAYSKTALADPESRAVYQAAARLAHRRAFNLAQSDYLRAPTIEKIDPGAYNGALGDRIRIEPVDDFEVVRVTVSIEDLAGNVLEAGLAVREGPDRCWWEYTAASTVARGQTVVIQATAEDRARNMVVERIHHALVADF